MTSQLLLIRHAAVADHYHGQCYGRSDVELSLNGQRRSLELSRELSSLPIARVMHSGMQRTRFLADELATALGQHAETCDLLQERDYGSWELQSWDSLYQQFGDEMSRVVSEPQTYRPGGGETTFELRDRVLRWFNSLSCEAITVAVTHGGPIAALRGACQGLPVADWLNLIPEYGEVTSLRYPSSLGTKVARPCEERSEDCPISGEIGYGCVPLVAKVARPWEERSEDCPISGEIGYEERSLGSQGRQTLGGA